MTVEQLAKATARVAKYYLDTSTILALASPFAKAAGQAVPSREDQRSRTASAFLMKVRAAGGTVRTSVLAFEEIAAKARRDARNELAKSAGFQGGWGHLETAGSDSIKAQVEAQARGAMTSVLSWAVQGLRAVGGEVETPDVPTNETTVRAERLRKAHTKLLGQHASIDPMDALHIVVGLALGAKDFVTFDHGWEQVPQITVYR